MDRASPEQSETASTEAKSQETGARDVLLAETDAGVLTLTLNRPAARNGLSEALLAGLKERVVSAGRDKDVKALVLAANGPVFCAGHDLKEMTARRADPDGGRAYYAMIMELCADVMQTIVRSPKPVIAAVHATATAAGCQLVASCDLAVAARSASFCTPGVNIGLFCSTPMVALSRNVPRKKAMEMLLLGEMMPADEAEKYGLVNAVVDDGEAMSYARQMADKIAAKSGRTIAIGKEAFYRQIEQPLSEAYDYAAGVMVQNMMERDAEEGIGAFIEKREPKWRD